MKLAADVGDDAKVSCFAPHTFTLGGRGRDGIQCHIVCYILCFVLDLLSKHYSI